MWATSRKKNVYFLKEGSLDERDILGVKGANLCEMYRNKLPVPPAFITHAQCSINYHNDKELPKALIDDIKHAVAKLESKTGKKFGGGLTNERPLLLSVRASTAKETPGLMNTVLNLGLNGNIVRNLIDQTNNGRWAVKSYIKFLQMFGVAVMGVDPAKFNAITQSVLDRQAVPLDSMFTMEDLVDIAKRFKLLAVIPDDPWEQLFLTIEAAYKSWYSPQAVKYRDLHSISSELGVAVTVQAMVFGTGDVFSGTGIVITRNPKTGDRELYGTYLSDAEGDELLDGKRKGMELKDMRHEQLEVYDKLLRAVENLENHYKDAQEVEFTVENLQLFVLETRRAKRTATAAVKIAVIMEREGILTEREALLRVDPHQLNYFMFPMLAEGFDDWRDPQVCDRFLGQGRGASGGVVTGQAVFTAEQVAECCAANQFCILIKPDTSGEDEDALKAARGVVTFKEGLSCHAAVVSRTWGKTAVVGLQGAQIAQSKDLITFTGKEGFQVRRGDVISVDGFSGLIYQGEVPISDHWKDEFFTTVMLWAEKYKRISILGDVNCAEDVTKAQRMGAEGIGLFRTEHMFLHEDRIDLFRHFILAEEPTERGKWTVQLIPLLQQDFLQVFPLTGAAQMSVRLLNPSLHEFLPCPTSPTFEQEVEEMANKLDLPLDFCQRRMIALQESNPMLGFRGCRLGIVYPEIIEMQVRAIVGAACELKRRNYVILPQIVLPALSTQHEVDRITSIISTVSDNVCAKFWTDSSFQQQYLQSKVSCMLETPRACHRSGYIAKSSYICDVLFNTDMLTSLVFGMAREDSYQFLQSYLTHHLVAHDPFRVIDERGVGVVLESATARIHKENAGTKIGVCGEHCGDPTSITFFNHLGVDYISCSPYRIPVAKVAAAQANINAEMRAAPPTASFKMFGLFGPTVEM